MTVYEELLPGNPGVEDANLVGTRL